MDYTSQSLLFKLKKTLRYVRLYGPSRTLVKVKGQYHFKKSYKSLPKIVDEAGRSGHVGLLGCGNYAYSNIAYYLKKNYGNVIRGCMDPNLNRAASLFEDYGLAYYTDDPQKLLDDPKIDTFYVASNHATHAPFAIEALKRNKHVHIEKPHCVTHAQLETLLDTMATSSGRVLSIGYNRPFSVIGQKIQSCLQAESGESMQSWFVAGHELDPDHWYFSPEEGGRVLGNLCHWIDFVYEMIEPENRYPITITPTRSERSDCDIAVSFIFGDGSIAAITFSAKGHTFEGVRERYASHRGNTLISMEDFKNLTVEIIDRKIHLSPFFRDHGHERSIVASYVAATAADSSKACSAQRVREVGEMFLETRDSLESNCVKTLSVNSE